MKGVLFCFVLLCFVFSCKDKVSSNPNLISSIKVEDSVNLKEIAFLDRLSRLKKEELPFKFHDYLLDSLQREGELLERIFHIAWENDSIGREKITYSKYLPTYSTPLNPENQVLSNYYGLLFMASPNYGGKCCFISDEIVFKRLNSFNINIEKFITLNRFEDEDNTRGVLLSIVTYNIKEDKEIDKKNILSAGIGYDNTIYYEGFIIYKDSILVKGYNYTEPEMYIINKRFFISKTGMIKSSYDIEIISHEEEL